MSDGGSTVGYGAAEGALADDEVEGPLVLPDLAEDVADDLPESDEPLGSDEPVDADDLDDADALDDADGLDDADDLDDADEDALGDEGIDEANRAFGALPAGVLEFLARSLVSEPEAVVVEVAEGRAPATPGSSRLVTLRLHVAADDMGKVIGRRGRLAQALRTVVRAAGAREGVDTHVDIVD